MRRSIIEQQEAVKEWRVRACLRSLDSKVLRHLSFEVDRAKNSLPDPRRQYNRMPALLLPKKYQSAIAAVSVMVQWFLREALRDVLC